MRRFPLLLLPGLLATLAAPPARAQFPSPANSTIPTHLVLVSSPAADVGLVQVVVRDGANNPMAGATVSFDFSACDDMTVASDQMDSGISADCFTHLVSALTGVDGVASFTILGKRRSAATSAEGSVKIYANGVLLGPVRTSALEWDGNGVLELEPDLTEWMRDLFSTEYSQRADFDGSGIVDVLDLSFWGARFFNPGTPATSGPYCK